MQFLASGSLHACVSRSLVKPAAVHATSETLLLTQMEQQRTYRTQAKREIRAFHDGPIVYE